MRNSIIWYGEPLAVLSTIVFMFIFSASCEAAPAPPAVTVEPVKVVAPSTSLPTMTATPWVVRITATPSATSEPLIIEPTVTATSIPAVVAPVIHEVEPGEYLRLIANRYYGNEMLWPVIWESTSLIYQTSGNPDLIRPGDLLIVPVR